MSTHQVTIEWNRGAAEFKYESYSRDHMWTFGTGSNLRASATREYRGTPTLVNPEEAFVAALSSCHMLTFLAMAARRKFTVEQYEDRAVGHLEKDGEGKLAVTRVVLSPRVVWGGEREPDATELARLHDEAHANCFVASSVKTKVEVSID